MTLIMIVFRPLCHSLAPWISQRDANAGPDDDYSSDDPMFVNAKKTMPGRLRELVERPTGCCATFARNLLRIVSAEKALAGVPLSNAICSARFWLWSR